MPDERSNGAAWFVFVRCPVFRRLRYWSVATGYRYCIRALCRRENHGGRRRLMPVVVAWIGEMLLTVVGQLVISAIVSVGIGFAMHSAGNAAVNYGPIQ